ncbi:uncharacterized protein LOC132757934 [Ruditapes philippinarum]|uniref:uncharacterized protein LOC132757934 n=1 Tax=Ruditapes philippinarum TaxID=129788 RepID=UPI00295C36BC|nr:uncharacterized protein LOC132757934 [Ruditapes philippinarum]
MIVFIEVMALSANPCILSRIFKRSLIDELICLSSIKFYHSTRTYVTRAGVSLTMPKKLGNVGPFWYCINTVHKNKKNAVVSSSIIIVSLIVTYGTHDLVHHEPLSTFPRLIFSPSVQLEERETNTSYLCYTNDVNISQRLGRRLNIFKGKISDNEFVFLSVGIDIRHILNINHLKEDSCFSVENTFLYHCCGYSPYLKDSEKNFRLQETNFEFERRVVTDNYFRVEDIFTGKPVVVDLTIKFRSGMLNHRIAEVISRHRCRGDVKVDHYPEVHIEVNINDHNKLSNQEFHWYL